MDILLSYFDLIEKSPDLRLGFYIYIFIFFAFIGSFMNVLIYRFPLILKKEYYDEVKEIAVLKEDISQELELPATLMGRSKCPNCGSKISIFLNIPLISWLLLLGKSKCCSKSISPRYFFVELITAIIPTYIFVVNGISFESVVYSSSVCLLIVMAFIDYDEYILPDLFVYLLLWLSLLSSSLGFININPSDAIVASIVCYIWMFSIAYLFKIITGKVGLGDGDIKLVAAAAALIGIYNVLIGLLIAVVIAIPLTLHKTKENDDGYMPFGPSLCIGFIIMLLQSI